MKNVAKKRLVFKKVTIANLNHGEMNAVRGGCTTIAGCPKQLDQRDTTTKIDTDTC